MMRKRYIRLDSFLYDCIEFVCIKKPIELITKPFLGFIKEKHFFY